MIEKRRRLLYALLPFVLLFFLSTFTLIYLDSFQSEPVDPRIPIYLYSLIFGSFIIIMALVALFVPRLNAMEKAAEMALNRFDGPPDVIEENIALSHNQATLRFTPTGLYVLENELFMPYSSLTFRVFKQYHFHFQTPIYYLNFRQFIRDNELYIEDNVRLTSSVHHFIDVYGLVVENIDMLYAPEPEDETIEAVITYHPIARWKRLSIYPIAIIAGLMINLAFASTSLHFIVIIPLLYAQQRFDRLKRKLIVSSKAVHLGIVSKKRIKSYLMLPYKDIELVIEEESTLLIKTFYAVLDFPYDAFLVTLLKKHIEPQRFIKNDLSKKIV